MTDSGLKQPKTILDILDKTQWPVWGQDHKNTRTI